MARPTGRRFSDREETQAGSTNSRAVTKEGLTNKNDRLPSGNADFMADVKRDIDITRKSDKPTTGAARASQEAAKERAMNRQGGRAGAVSAALSAGYGAGRYIGERGGDELVRKGIEKSGLGSAIDKAAAGSDRVELSKEAKERIKSGELEKGTDERVNKKDYPTYEKETKSAETFRKEFKDAKESGKDSFKFEGREYNTQSEYAKGGIIVNKGVGASMKPHNVFQSKGKK